MLLQCDHDHDDPSVEQRTNLIQSIYSQTYAESNQGKLWCTTNDTRKSDILKQYYFFLPTSGIHLEVFKAILVGSELSIKKKSVTVVKKIDI